SFPFVYTFIHASIYHCYLRFYPTRRSSDLVFGHHRNLLVAATGTGKTVVAALDYRRLGEEAGGKQPSLLFVAHRKEILVQALRTDRKSTRLNSSHVSISYAVFCLKKKNNLE